MTLKLLPQEVEPISPPLEAGLLCDLLWPIGCSERKGAPVPSLGLRRP